MKNTTQNEQQVPSKLFGAYPQKQEGLYMQRIPVFAGQLTPLQLQQLAVMATEFTQSTPLHLTSRQDIELHHVPAEHLNTIREKLHQLDLPTFGAGGDSVRNITVCPCCRFNADAYDVLPLADLIKEFLHDNPLLRNMPRKFKISLAGCDRPRSKPFVNDLSFVATGRTTVRVVGAGSLGARPAAGIVLYENLPIKDVLLLTAASLKFFVAHGDRENRRKARFRHIRERLGDAAFLEKLNDYFQTEKASGNGTKLELENGLAGWSHLCLQAINGDLDVQHALLLARAAAEQNAQLRINLTHGIDIYSQKPFELPAELKPLTELPCIVACPGSTTCTNGLTNCPQLAKQLAELLRGNGKLKGKTIALSGCPNNCVHSSVADIGLSGQIKTIDGKRRDVYKVMLNGGNGMNEKLAEKTEIISAEVLPDFFKNFRATKQAPLR
ncbi:MAG: nitrite/sulfite reductase [Planctomycetes bacterium]|nr:nitrite/sulfite reductase [Planctomycetota bacterium]